MESIRIVSQSMECRKAMEWLFTTISSSCATSRHIVRRLKTIGSKGDGKEQFKRPSFITSADNKLYVTEYGNNGRVKVMDEQGTFVDQFSASNPTGIAISGKDIIVSEYGKGQVSLYDKNHKFAKVLLECSNPWGVFITGRGRVIVTADKIYISGMVGVDIVL